MTENRNLLAHVVIFVLLGAVLWYFKSTILLAFLAVLLALIMNLPTSALLRRGWRPVIAYPLGILTCLTIILLIFVAVIPALISGVEQIIQTYPNALDNLEAGYAKLRKVVTFLPELSALNAQGDSGFGNFALSAVSGGLSTIAGALGQTLILFVVSIFLLLAPADYRSVLLRMFPKAQFDRTNDILDQIQNGLNAWIKTLGMSISVTFVMVLVSFLVIGFPYAFEIAVITGVATFIPTLGAFLPVIPIVIFGLTASNPWIILLALGIYILVQQIEGNVITPSFQKAELSILPAGVLLFQIIAAQIFGVLGVLMAVPILVVFMTLIRELYCKDMMGWDD